MQARIAQRIDVGTLIGVAMVCLIGLAALLPRVRAGGFHADDWVDAANYYLHPGHGFWAAFNHTQETRREAYGLVRTIDYAVFGMHSARHLMLTAAVAIGESSLLVLVARRLGVAAAPAAAMGVLLLALPDADSTRLWSNGVQMELFAGLLPLAGLWVALSGLRVGGRRGVALHCLALLMYAVSVNGYELGAPLIVLFGLAYRRISPGPGARRRWAADVAVVAAVLTRYSLLRSPAPIHGAFHHLVIIVRDGLGVTARALIPVRGITPALVLVPAAAIVAVAVVLMRANRLDSGAREELRRALLTLAAGVVVTAAGWVMIIPAALGYDPGSSGVGNRINATAAIGLAAAVVAFASIVAILVTRVLRAARVAPSLLAALLVVPIAAADIVRLEQDVSHWNHAADVNRFVLVRLRQLVPNPAPGTTVFTFGVSGYSAPSVPIFGGGGNNDLLGAVRVTYGTSSVGGFPVLGGMHFSCARDGMALLHTGASSSTPYGLALLVDMRGAGHVLIPRRREDCLKETAQLAPYAPVNASN